MIYSVIIVSFFAGIAANLNEDKDNTRLCYLYAQVILFSGLVVHSLGVMIAIRDETHSLLDELTSFYISYQSIVPALLNLFAISLFAYAKRFLYRLLVVPLALSVMYNIAVPVENLVYGTTYIWEKHYIIPLLCGVEIALLIGGSDVVRDKFARSFGNDDIRGHSPQHNKVSDHRDTK